MAMCLGRIGRAAATLLAFGATAALWSCAPGPVREADGISPSGGGLDATGSVSATLGPGEMAGAFDAARETLRDYRFAIDRVDAARGVITTHPKRTAGLATPWDREQSGLDQEWEDLLNEQRRVVRIEFTPAPSAGAPVVEAGGAMRVTVEVVRTHRPDWRIESESIRLSSHARSRDAMGRIEPRSSVEMIGLDARLARRIARDVLERLRSAAAEP